MFFDSRPDLYGQFETDIILSAGMRNAKLIRLILEREIVIFGCFR